MYVSIRGVVRGANMSLSSGRHVTELQIRTDSGYVAVTMDNPDPDKLKGWLDSEVEVSGVSSGRFDGKMQQTGAVLHVSSYRDVRVLRPAARDPWSRPATPMDKVLETYSQAEHTERVRVEGVLTYYHQGQMAVLENGSRSIRVLTPELDPLMVGDRAEAIGIPFVDNGFLTLKLGAIRTLGPASPVVPAHVTWDGMVSGKHAFDLVSMDGKLVSQVRQQAQDVYIVSSSGHLFSATVRHPFVYEWGVAKPPPAMPAIEPGSDVKVTGVAILDDGNPFNGAMAFGILMRTADDVTVVARPSWLNVPNLMKIVTMLLALIVVVGAWGWMLQRKVHGQTRSMASRIEAEALVERRRSQILEDINSGRPLDGILAQIAGLVSLQLGAAPCCCELADGTNAGTCNGAGSHLKRVRHEIPSRNGPPLGAIYADIDFRALSPGSAADALTMGASLAALAIENAHLYSDLVHRSEFDLLTDVRNRFSLEQTLDRLITEAGENGHIFGLIYIDLDHFKQVNDRYGHQTGDRYLQAAAARMKHQLRPEDMLARPGGDEFAVVVREIPNRAAVEEIAQRMEQCFDAEFSLPGCEIKGAASIGMALYPEDGSTRDSLLSTADAAMYVAKQIRSTREHGSPMHIGNDFA
jgi:diguanylate cyclase (GGDEF)-like protein